MSDKVKIILASILAFMIAIFLVFISLVKYNIINMGDSNNSQVITNENNNTMTCTLEETENDLTSINNIYFTFDANNFLKKVNTIAIFKSTNTKTLESIKTVNSTMSDTLSSYDGITSSLNDIEGGIELIQTYDFNIINEQDISKNNIDISFSKTDTKNSIMTVLKNKGYTCN